MRAIIVGAGAVGQVYGHHLARGGADVAVLVRPRRRAEAEAGYTLTRISAIGRRHTETFTPSAVLTNTAEAIGRRAVDQIWLCVPTDALEDALLHDLAKAVPGATFVSLSPGYFVRERVISAVGEARAVFGGIGMISYVSPLEGSDQSREKATPPGIAFFLSPTKISGRSERRALEVVSALRAGGCATDLVSDASVEVAFGSSFLMPTVASLELADWSFKTFRADGHAELASRAIKEGLKIASAMTAHDPPPFAPLLGPFALNAATLAIPPFAPLDVETFLRVHFEKVGDQTRLLLSQTIADGQARGLEVGALKELLAALDATRKAGPVSAR